MSKYPKLAGAPHHKVLKNVKLNALCHGIGNLMVRLNGDRVRYIKYEIPCNAIVRHEKLDTLWRSSCTAMPVFCQRTIGRNLKGYIVKASTWLYAIQRRRRRLCMARHGYTGTTAIRLDVRNVSSLVYVTLVQSTSTTSVAAATYRRQAEDRQTDGRTNEWTDSRTDRRMDGWMAGSCWEDGHTVHEHTSMCYSK